ncbi:MAG TPA: hypothetical protein VJC10_02905 [Patescibacteria group bacterium]|nr:hypothetical protein [Patescibacteria group bacterium]
MACPIGEKEVSGFLCIPQDPAGFTGALYGIGLGLIGGVAVLFLMYGGYIILASQGNPQQVNLGKSYIFYAIIGVLLAIFGFVFFEILLKDILNVPGFG